MIVLTTARAETPPEARWLGPGADVVAALTVTPGECRRRPDDPQTDYLAEVGRAAFSSPLLLGGQAARNGLSCASCHVDGRSNPDFFLEGLSGEAGTADVSSSIFSKVRDDGVFNPLPIPTLVGAAAKASFGTASFETSSTPHQSLKMFIASAVADEFQGAPPPETVIAGLVAYVESLRPEDCPGGPSLRTPRRSMNDVARTLNAARKAHETGDRPTADFLLASAQAALGRVHARFPGDQFAKERAALVALSLRIGEARGWSDPLPLAGEGGDPGVKPGEPGEGRAARTVLSSDFPSPPAPLPQAGEGGRVASARDQDEILRALDRDTLKLGARLEKKKSRSLYDASALSAYLKRTLSD